MLNISERAIVTIALLLIISGTLLGTMMVATGHIYYRYTGVIAGLTELLMSLCYTNNFVEH
jgi:hypothetical protein